MNIIFPYLIARPYLDILDYGSLKILVMIHWDLKERCNVHQVSCPYYNVENLCPNEEDQLVELKPILFVLL